MNELIKLAPSDLTFLWEECRRCFWLKHNGVLSRPRTPFPKIFSTLDRATKQHFIGKRTEEVAEGIKPGIVNVPERFVRSIPFLVPHHARPVVLAGRIDAACTFDDDSFGIIDYKTSVPKPEHAFFYSRQLHAYAWAAEHPGDGKLHLDPVTQLGLVTIEPVSMVALGQGTAFRTEATFTEIDRDDDAFAAFLSQVLFVLELEEPPAPTPDCPFCDYLAVGSLVLLTGYYGGNP
jgi:hypothetical protein